MVRASSAYERVIVRRPHAYGFIQSHTAEHGGIRSATPSGVTLADGTEAPLPGLYVLDAEGRILDSLNLLGSDLRDSVLEMLTAHR